MRLLLDTHALLWWLAGDLSLPTRAQELIGEPSNEVFVSAASIWEISTKHRIGKLPGVEPILNNFDDVIAGQGFRELPIIVRHAQIAGGLPGPHRDPFDRMLVAQAMLQNLILISNEVIFDQYPVNLIWS
jgi:PIN domain nuclease of toxin-antitoxin system